MSVLSATPKCMPPHTQRGMSIDTKGVRDWWVAIAQVAKRTQSLAAHTSMIRGDEQ